MKEKHAHNLIILLGPTGVGKTELSLQVANCFNTDIISCDSRQIYREMSIGTAVPDSKTLKAVPHHFIRSHSIQDPFNASRFELEVLQLLDQLFISKNTVVMAGGSMLYIDAVCNGIDDLPDIDPLLRVSLKEKMESEGIESLRKELKLLDPEYYFQTDLKNPVRIIHALEVCYMTGQSYSSRRSNLKKKRDFNIIRIGLNRDREELYSRIDVRVDEMMLAGLEQEAQGLLPYRNLNPLNTVGYRELFDYFDGKTTLAQAIEKIKFNTHKYARKQLTWFRKDPEIRWFHPDQEKDILHEITSRIRT